MKLKMHDEINSMDISKKMLELTTIPFSPMNPSIPMKRKYSSSSHHYRPHLTSSASDISTEATNVVQNIDDCEEEDDDNSRSSSNLAEHVNDEIISIKSDSSSVMANNNATINLPSPPSSTRSSFDAAIHRDSFLLSNGDLSENNFDHHTNTSNVGDFSDIASHDDDMIEEISMNSYDNDVDDEIKLIAEELIENVIDSAEEDDWDSIKIDLDGETILPSGLRIVKGVADMAFYREDDKIPYRFTNQLNFLKTILTKYICRYKAAVPFLNPVDSVRLKIPHYYLVIRKPMDLNTVKNRLNFLWYQSASECISDIRQIFKNCYKFNSSNDYVYSVGKKLEEFFDEKLKDMPLIEEEIPCPPRQNIEEFLKLNEKRILKRRSGSMSDSIDGQSSSSIGEGSLTFSPIKMTTRSERGVMVRKPSKDLPAPISTPPVKQPTVKKVPLNKPMKECCKFVKELFTKKHAEYAWPFWKPVNPEEYPDYLQKIKKPIDLTTIKMNIQSGKYTTVDDFAKDMRLMFSNCLRYNPPESPIIEQARQLREAFEYRYAQFPEEYLKEKLVVPKHNNYNNNNNSFTFRQHTPSASTSSSHHISDSSNSSSKSNHGKKMKLESNNKKISIKSRVSHNESGQSFSPLNVSMLTDRHNGNCNTNSNEPASEDRMKMLEFQVACLREALTTALSQNPEATAATALLNAIAPNSNGLQNGKRTYTKRQKKNGYKSKTNTKLSQKSNSKKRKHLSSDEEDDDSNSEADDSYQLTEPFNPESIEDLKKLKKDLENLHATDLQNVLRILQSTEPSLRCDDELNVEIDFEALKPKTLIALRKYVTSCMLNSNNKSPSNSGKICNQPSSSSSMTDQNCKKISRASSNNFDTDCDNTIQNNWSRADSRASNLQLSESSSDSESD